MTAVYLAEVASPRLREFVKPMVELLAALPSVVIGFFGMVLVAPFLQNVFGIPTGLNLFNAALMLAFMSIPTICSISEDAILAIPQEYKNASLALGANRWQTLSHEYLHAIWSLNGLEEVYPGAEESVAVAIESLVVPDASDFLKLHPASLIAPVLRSGLLLPTSGEDAFNRGY